MLTIDTSTGNGLNVIERYDYFKIVDTDLWKVYIVGVHHDQLHLTTAEFSKDYIKWVSEGHIPNGEFLVVRSSRRYDLSQPDSRIEAAKTILGLIRYINY